MDEKLELKDDAIWLNEDMKKELQYVYDHYRHVCNQNEYLKKENERLKSESYKDEELSRMKKKYDKMCEDYLRGFPISDEEDKKINEWIDEIEKDGIRVGAIGGRLTYHFIVTSIGEIGTVEDIIKKKKLTFRNI